MNEIKIPDVVDVEWARLELERTGKKYCNKYYVYYVLRADNNVDWVDLSNVRKKKWKNKECVDWDNLKRDVIIMSHNGVNKKEFLSFYKKDENDRILSFSNNKKMHRRNLINVKIKDFFRIRVSDVEWLSNFFTNKKYFMTLMDVPVNSHLEVSPTCPCCGRIKSMMLKTLYNQGVGCIPCSTSRSNGETITQIVLELNKEHFKSEKTYEECKDIKRLPFDFFLIDKNILIEVQGIQHSNKKEYSFNKKQKNEEVIKRDIIKKDFARRNNINLIEIEYYTSDYNKLIKEIETKLPFIEIDYNEVMNSFIKRSHERWDYEDIKNRYLSEESNVSIAKSYDCDSTQISYIAKMLGIYKPKKNMVNKKIRCLNTGKVFNTLKDAKEWALNGSKIGEVCKGNRKSAGRHPETNEPLTWEYVD